MNAPNAPEHTPARVPSLWRAALLIAHKDLRIELRTRSALYSALAFAVLALTIFFFAWDPTAVAASDLAPGAIWVVFLFASTLGLHRSFGIEQPTRAIDALVAAPVDREALFLGKVLANLVVTIAIQVVIVPMAALLYNVSLSHILFPMLGILFAAAVGVVAVGTLMAAMAVNTRMAELLLPLLALPFFVPIVISAAQATAMLAAGRPLGAAADYVRLLVAFDVVAVVIGTLVYPSLIEQ